MKKIDLIGQRFGHLIVTKEAPHKIDKSGRKRVCWYCNCDCGVKDVIASSNDLRLGKTVSCGGKCKLRVKPNNYAAKNTVFLYYRNNAKKRNISFLLTKKDLFSLIEQPCFYCGRTESNIINKDTYSYKYNGIDRMDSSVGYEKDNVVACCKYCNRAKSDMSIEDFENWILQVVNYMKLGNER